MIENAMQYKITKSMVKQFEDSLKKLEGQTAASVVHPRALELEKEALRSQLDSLRGEIKDYETSPPEKRIGWGS